MVKSEIKFVVLEKKDEIKKAHSILIDALSKVTTEKNKLIVPARGGSSKEEVNWIESLGIWWVSTIKYNGLSYWNVFGTDKPDGTKKYSPPIIVEINPPTKGMNKKTKAQYVRDQYGEVYLSHSGIVNVQGGTKTKFYDVYSGSAPWVKASFSDGTKEEFLLISKLNDKQLPNRIADYVKTVENFKNPTKQAKAVPVHLPMGHKSEDTHVLDNLIKKGLTITHIQALKKFLVLKDQIIKDSSKIRGEKGVSKIPGDIIVSQPHYLHNLVRGVYKPEGDDYAQSILTNPESKWGTEIDFETGNWKIYYNFGEGYKFPSDIKSLRKCYDDDIPIGVIFRHRKGVNQILGLGRISKIDGTRFEIIPFHIDEKVEKIEEIAKEYAKEQMANRDFSAQGSETTILIRGKQQAFREILLKEYNTRCAICGFNIEDFLNAAHIVPFKIMKKEYEKNAMDPRDGILLCRLCDVAFENGKIQILPNYDIKISDTLKNKSSNNTSVKSWLSNIGKKISIKEGSTYKPDPKYLKRKNELNS